MIQALGGPVGFMIVYIFYQLSRILGILVLASMGMTGVWLGSHGYPYVHRNIRAYHIIVFYSVQRRHIKSKLILYTMTWFCNLSHGIKQKTPGVGQGTGTIPWVQNLLAYRLRCIFLLLEGIVSVGLPFGRYLYRDMCCIVNSIYKRFI